MYVLVSKVYKIVLATVTGYVGLMFCRRHPSCIGTLLHYLLLRTKALCHVCLLLNLWPVRITIQILLRFKMVTMIVVCDKCLRLCIGNEWIHWGHPLVEPVDTWISCVSAVYQFR